MRIMAIDIGTNSTLHLVVDLINDELQIVERGIVENILGMGLKQNNRLDPSIIEKNKHILTDLMLRAEQLGCVNISAVGTHVLRQASNGSEFIEMSNAIGLPIEIISAQTEAALGWKGLFGWAGTAARVAVLDIGGGSSELSCGNGVKPDWTTSIPVAAVNTTQNFFLHDPPLGSEIQTAIAHIKTSFSDWRGKLGAECSLIGTAGTITSIAAIQNKITEYLPGVLEGITLRRDQIAGWKGRLLTMTELERNAVIGMSPARAGNIHAGVLILDNVLELLSIDEIAVSEKGVLFGLAHMQIENMKNRVKKL